MNPSSGQSLIEDFMFIEDAQERLGAVVDRARQLAPIPTDERTCINRVPGCISQVWLISEIRDGHCYFRCDADGPLVKGLVAFLCAYYEGGTPADILADDTDPLAALDLLRNLSPHPPKRTHGRARCDTCVCPIAHLSPSPNHTNGLIPVAGLVAKSL